MHRTATPRIENAETGSLKLLLIVPAVNTFQSDSTEGFMVHFVNITKGAGTTKTLDLTVFEKLVEFTI